MRLIYGRSATHVAPRWRPGLPTAKTFASVVILFAVGLVGEYVAKIMEEVKGRPRLIRSVLLRNGEMTHKLVASELAPLYRRTTAASGT